MRVNATHWRVFLTQKLAILMKKQSRNELSLAPSTRTCSTSKIHANVINFATFCAVEIRFSRALASVSGSVSSWRIIGNTASMPC
ncbi:hypothetical protein SAMN02746062_00230 [Alysiella filiformis DSM 16848]|uniref:Uncharacterized protein n=1 Tax=Alysiella filiformis DSM 16848 TaxID=1120981 RepID=A0A286E313_9NEIS|nr:hypothetical protein SAMN02746062_00230 [Alysiella filiformis DSM 16848]